MQINIRRYALASIAMGGRMRTMRHQAWRETPAPAARTATGVPAMRTLTMIFISILSGLAAHPAWAQSALMKQAQGLFKPIPEQPPAQKDNPASPSKVALGKMLYFEPRLSQSHSISCNSCHMVGMGGVDLQETSLGHRWQHGGRNAPTVYNAVFDVAQFWDGRAKDLEQQAGGPLVNPVEMDTTEAHVVEQLKGIPGYAAVFARAFPGSSDPITFDNVRKAIAVFEATLITPDAPFDRYLKGDENALDAEQKAGLALFINKGCAACHNGVNVGGGMYAPFGVVERPGADILPPGDKGRFAVTRTASDEYVFRVPSLRNIVLTAPYFHTGKVWDLRQAIAIMGSSQLGATLSDSDVSRIEAFMGSLTGEQPRVTLPILPPSVATTPRPKP
jgi:cytochrome c peroxidase